MTIKGVRFNGDTYVKLDDVVAMLRRDANGYLLKLPGNLYGVASATAIGAEAGSLEKAFKNWHNKADDVEPKRKFR